MIQCKTFQPNFKLWEKAINNLAVNGEISEYQKEESIKRLNNTLGGVLQ